MLFRGPQARRYTQIAVQTQGGIHTRRSVATTGVMSFKGPQGGFLLFQEAHGVGGVSERAGSSAGRTTVRRFGRLSRPTGIPPGGVGRIFGRNPWWRSRPADFGRPTPPLATSLSAEPHRRRASPPFHSDELHAVTPMLGSLLPKGVVHQHPSQVELVITAELSLL